MHFGIDGGGIGAGGVITLMMTVAVAFSVMRYNNLTRPSEQLGLADQREAELLAHEAEHKSDLLL